MRYRKYYNWESGRRKIYSDEDLLKMTLMEMLEREKELAYQHNTIGIPSVDELLNSSYREEYLGDHPDYIKPNNQGLENSIMHIQPDNIRTVLSQIDNRYSNMPIYMSGEGTIDNPENDDETNWEPSEYQLEEGIQKIRNPIVEDAIDNIKNDISDIAKKYEGLDVATTAQKAVGKVLPTVYADYYGLSSRLNDDDEIPERILKENDIYKLSDIQDKQIQDEYAKAIAKGRGLDINNPETIEQIKNTKIVTPKEQSRLYESIRNTEAFDKWISENYDKIKQGDNNYNQSIEFPFDGVLKSKDVRNATGTIHKADMKNAKINDDGSMTVDLRDWYNFEKWNLKKHDKNETFNDWYKKSKYNGIAKVNNNAYKQQQAGQLEPYLISLPIHISREELEEIIKRQKNRKR